MSTSACHAVSAASGSAAACTWSIFPGLRANCGRGGHVLGVRAAAVRGTQHAEHLVTRPVESVPDADCLDDAGDVPAEDERRLAQDRRAVARDVFQSVGLTPAARTRTSTSVGPGVGRSDLYLLSTSGPPRMSWLIARIVVVVMTTSISATRRRSESGQVINMRKDPANRVRSPPPRTGPSPSGCCDSGGTSVKLSDPSEWAACQTGLAPTEE